MSQFLEFYIIASTADRYAALQREFASLPHVHLAKNYTEAVHESGGFDAFFESLMSAREWGSVPLDAPLYQTRVIRMPEPQIVQGRPRYGIPGIPIARNDELTAKEATRLILHAALEAIGAFNNDSLVKLHRIGAVDTSLGLDEIDPGEAADIFKSLLAAYADANNSNMSIHTGQIYSDLHR